jgi:undecaprenyl-diphosphatase
VVEQFSKLGEHGAIWVGIGLAGAAADEPRREEWLRGVRRVGIAYAVNQLVKVIVRRERPADKAADTLSNLSFPSAHTTTSFCGARMYRRLGVNLYPLALALAASRLALRVHHPSDVAAGAVLGTVIAR